MSFTYQWQSRVTFGRPGPADYCALSGKYIRHGYTVMKFDDEAKQRYGLFLSEQKNMEKLVGTPLISKIMGYLIDDTAKLAISTFGSITYTTRSGRITKKPLRLSDAKFVPGGSHAHQVDQYDRGYNRGEHYDIEKYSHDLKRDVDETYNAGDIVDDDDVEYSSVPLREEAEWEYSDSEETSASEWEEDDNEEEEIESDDEKYNVFEDGF